MSLSHQHGQLQNMNYVSYLPDFGQMGCGLPIGVVNLPCMSEEKRQTDLDDLLDQLERTTQLPRNVLGRVVAEVVEHHREPVEHLVRRRHRELQAAGLSNSLIWTTLTNELSTRVVASPQLSERQLRRIVYG
jgi:hypothetical protein